MQLKNFCSMVVILFWLALVSENKLQCHFLKHKHEVGQKGTKISNWSLNRLYHYHISGSQCHWEGNSSLYLVSGFRDVLRDV